MRCRPGPQPRSPVGPRARLGRPPEPASGAPPCVLAPLGSSRASLSPWLLLLCSPPCPLCPFAPAACRPPLLALSAGPVSSRRPSGRLDTPSQNSRRRGTAPAQALPGVRGADRLTISPRSVRFAGLAAVQSLPRGTGLGRHPSPRLREKGRKCVCSVPSSLEAAQKSLDRAHWAGRGLGPSSEPGCLAGPPAPGFTPPRGWLGFAEKIGREGYFRYHFKIFVKEENSPGKSAK